MSLSAMSLGSTIWQEIFVAKNFCRLDIGKDSQKRFRSLMIAKPYMQSGFSGKCSHDGKQVCVEAMVHGYLVLS